MSYFVKNTALRKALLLVSRPSDIGLRLVHPLQMVDCIFFKLWNRKETNVLIKRLDWSRLCLRTQQKISNVNSVNLPAFEADFFLRLRSSLLYLL